MRRFYLVTLLFLAAFVAAVIWGGAWAALPLVLVYLSVLVYASWYVGSGFYVSAECKLHNHGRDEVALTFDDGPDPVQTPIILDKLRAAGFRATFFCIGEKIAAYPDVVERMVVEGHSVGNHTFHHGYNFPMLGADKMKDELQRTQTLVEQLTQRPCVLFRPPFGVTNPLLHVALHGMCFRVIGWNVRSLDTTALPREKVLERVTKRLCEGDIVLMHDTSEDIGNLLDGVIGFMKAKGLKSVAIR